MKVTLLDNSIQSKLLAVSTSYISFDWNDKDSATVYVTMNFESTQFTETSKDCADNGCVTFTGNTINGDDNYVVTCDANWLDIARNDEDHSFSVTCINDNEGEKDRIGKIDVSYCGLTKTIDVVQFANTSYITYTITSNAEDGAKVKFGNEHTTTLKDGIAEYTRRQVGAQKLQVTISGGLPSSSVNYTFKNTGDTTAFTVSNLGVPDFIPPLEAYKITSQYTYDENLNSVLTSTTVYCSPGERKNVEIFVMNNKDEVSWSVEEPDYSWIHPIRYINDYVVIDRNENNVERSAILTYHIDESPSTTFRCKVMQTKGQYTFQFHSGKPWNQTIIAASNTFTIVIDSYLNSEDNLIAFEASYNSDEVSVVTNSKSATINLKRNYLLGIRHVRINFIQNKSNKRITLYVIQKEAECKIGDVYAYNAITKQYACFRFSIGENIANGFTPIGVVVMPFDNDCTSNRDFARVISLTESKYDSKSGIPYDWPMRLENNSKKIKETKDPYYEAINVAIGYEHFTSLSDENYIGNSYDKNYMSLYPMNEYRALGSVYKDSYKIAFDNGQRLYYAKEIRRERGHVEYDFKRKMKPFTKDNSNTKMFEYNGIFQLQNDYLQEKSYAYTDFKGKENFTKENKQLFGKGTYNDSLYNYISNYSTSGTKTGDWYLGSVGEMSYVSVYSKIINQTLNLLSSKYTITPIDTNDNLGGFVGWNKNEHDNYDTSDDGYWTSTMSKRLGEWHDFYVSAIVVIGTGMIGWQEHQRRDNAHHLTLKRVRPMLMINKSGYPL